MTHEREGLGETVNGTPVWTGKTRVFLLIAMKTALKTTCIDREICMYDATKITSSEGMQYSQICNTVRCIIRLSSLLTSPKGVAYKDPEMGVVYKWTLTQKWVWSKSELWPIKGCGLQVNSELEGCGLKVNSDPKRVVVYKWTLTWRRAKMMAEAAIAPRLSLIESAMASTHPYNHEKL